MATDPLEDLLVRFETDVADQFKGTAEIGSLAHQIDRYSKQHPRRAERTPDKRHVYDSTEKMLSQLGGETSQGMDRTAETIDLGCFITQLDQHIVEENQRVNSLDTDYLLRYADELIASIDRLDGSTPQAKELDSLLSAFDCPS